MLVLRSWMKVGQNFDECPMKVRWKSMDERPSFVDGRQMRWPTMRRMVTQRPVVVAMAKATLQQWPTLHWSA